MKVPAGAAAVAGAGALCLAMIRSAWRTATDQRDRRHYRRGVMPSNEGPAGGAISPAGGPPAVRGDEAGPGPDEDDLRLVEADRPGPPRRCGVPGHAAGVRRGDGPCRGGPSEPLADPPRLRGARPARRRRRLKPP